MINLEQAREISRRSAIPTDECTFVPEFGIGKDCTMHDHLLGLFVTFKNKLNKLQIEYMLEQGLSSYVECSLSNGKSGTRVTRKQIDHLFREALQEKIDTEGAWYKKFFYWNIRNVYYFGVTIWRRIKQ